MLFIGFVKPKHLTLLRALVRPKSSHANNKALIKQTVRMRATYIETSGKYGISQLVNKTVDYTLRSVQLHVSSQILAINDVTKDMRFLRCERKDRHATNMLIDLHPSWRRCKNENLRSRPKLQAKTAE